MGVESTRHPPWLGALSLCPPLPPASAVIGAGAVDTQVYEAVGWGVQGQPRTLPSKHTVLEHEMVGP